MADDRLLLRCRIDGETATIAACFNGAVRGPYAENLPALSAFLEKHMDHDNPYVADFWRHPFELIPESEVPS